MLRDIKIQETDNVLSFNIVLLFTRVLPEESLHIWSQQRSQTYQTSPHILYYGIFCCHIDGVAMGSPAILTTATFFMGSYQPAIGMAWKSQPISTYIWMILSWSGPQQNTVATNFYVSLTVHLSIILVINQLNAQKSCFIISLSYASTCFEHYALIIRWSKLYYTASGITTPVGVVGCNIRRFYTVQLQGHQSKLLILKYSWDLSFKLIRRVYLSSPILLHTTPKPQVALIVTGKYWQGPWRS